MDVIKKDKFLWKCLVRNQTKETDVECSCPVHTSEKTKELVIHQIKYYYLNEKKVENIFSLLSLQRINFI